MTTTKDEQLEPLIIKAIAKCVECGKLLVPDEYYYGHDCESEN